MKTNVKTLLIVLLVIVLLSVLTVFASAESEPTIVDCGTCGANVTWMLDNNGLMTISGKGNMTDYSYNPANGYAWKAYPFHSYRSAIKTLVIGNGVTSIGDYAFYNCTNLALITISNSVTSIGNFAFRSCTELNTVAIPNSVTSIGDGAFIDCTGLTSATIPNNVTSLGTHAFCNCSSLTSVKISNSIASIGMCSFEGCTSLTSVIIPDSVTSIGDSAFSGCTSLSSVTISNNTINIGEDAFKRTAFYNNSENWEEDALYLGSCLYKVRSSVQGSFRIKDGIKGIGASAFEGNTGLTSVIIPNGITSIGSKAFFRCTSLTSATVPDSVISIGDGAFSYTALLDNDENWGGDALYLGCCLYKVNPSLRGSFRIKDGTKSICYEAFYGCANLTSVSIPDSVISIGNHAFRNCTSLTTVIIPDSVTSIGGSAFNACTSLISVYIPSSVTSIGTHAFYGCSSLTSVTIPNSVTTIGMYSFCRCVNLKSMCIPESVISIGIYAFGSCVSLTAITVDSNNANFASDEAGCLYTKDQTTLIQYPIGNARTSFSIPNVVISIGDSAFEGCTGLRSVTIPNSVTSLGIWTFYDCTGLTSVTIPEHATIVGDHVFCGCSSLKSINIPNSVSDIEMGAFAHCSSLVSVTIGESVTNITSMAFYCCSSIKDVYYEGTEKQWNAITISSYNEPLTNANIHYKPHVHSFGEGIVTTPATCTTPGERTYTCSCGEKYTEAIEIDITNHVHKTNKDAVASNCKETGFTAGVWCSDCKTWISGHTVTAINPNSHADLDENGNCPRCGKHVKDTVKPTDPTDEKTATKLNIFQRIIQWFRNFFAKLFGKKK